MKVRKVALIFISLVLIASLAGCTPTAAPIEEPPVVSVLQPGSSVLQNALDVVELLKVQDMISLEAYIHPENGVRFSPYGYIDTTNNQLFTASQIPGLPADTQTYLWGSYDGSGDPIQLNFNDYYDEFIYDADFASPNLIGNNVVVGTGNSLINIVEAYPGAVFVEFHFTGFDPQYSGMDWTSLRLVFEEIDGIWYLSGIVHDQWTI